MMLLRINRTVCKRVRVNVKLLTATKSTTSSDKAKNQKLIDALKNVPKHIGTKRATSSDESKNQDLFDALKNVPKPTRPRNSMSSDETKKYQNPFDALKNVRARPPKPESLTYEYPRADPQKKNELNREAAFKNGFDKKKDATTVLEGLKLPKLFQSSEKSSNISLPNKKPLAPPVKTDEPTKWKKRSFLALVAEQKEDSKIFDALKAVATYSSKDKDESEDILVKMKVPEHEIHPSLLPEVRKPPKLLEQLTEK